MFVRDRVVFEADGSGIEGPKKRVAELLLSILLSGARGRSGKSGVGRAPNAPPLIRRRERGEPVSDEDEVGAGEPRPRWLSEGNATGPLCLGRGPMRQGIPDCLTG